VSLKFIPGLFATLFPEDWRRRFFAWLAPTSAHATVSGVVELVLCLAWLVWSFLHFMPAEINSYVGQASAHPGGETKMVEHAGGVAVAYGMGFTALLIFLFRWQTVVACYFAFEGVVRATGGIVSGDVVPTVPLVLLHGVVRSIQRGWRELQLPPLVADAVTREDGQLRIASCRPNPGWHPLLVISYRDELFELAEVTTGDKARPWVYLLRPAPVSKIARGFQVYDPEDVLDPKART